MVMGFRLKREYVLLFEGTALEGAEVTLKATPVAAFLRVRETNDALKLAEILCEYVVSWNLETENGEPLLIDANSVIAELEASVMAAIIRAWMDAASGVTAPLDGPSISGEPFPVESMSMETLSESLPN
jgi:hypothetical protein